MGSQVSGVGRPVVFFQSRPTQVDAPFFRALTSLGANVHVVFRHIDQRVDHELGLQPDFGDVAEGYSWATRSADIPTAAHVVVEGWHHSWTWARILGMRSAESRTLGVRFDNLDLGSVGRVGRTASQVRAQLALRMAQVWHPTSEASLVWAQSLTSKMREVVAIPYQISPSLFQPIPEHHQRLGPLRLLVVAKLHEREGVADVLRALENLDEWSATIVGDGPARASLEGLAHHLGVDADFVGYVPYEELPEFYQTHSLFVHAAHFEPWGVSIQEAMACGLPVLASDAVGAANELLPMPAVEWRFKSGATHQLQALLRQMQNPELRGRHAAANLAAARRNDPMAAARRLIRYLSGDASQSA